MSFVQPSPLDRFRTQVQRLRLHPLEQALLWIVGGHLVFLPWALGGMRPWTQAVSLGLAAVGMLLALWPRNYAGDLTTGPDYRLLTWPKLVRFPVFWAGLVLLAYMLVQASNPAWTYSTTGKVWWLSPRDHVAWLPTSVSAPWLRGNPWRHLMTYTAAWLVVCSIWIGFTRRRTLQLFFVTLAVNAFLLTGLGFMQRLTAARKIFWSVTSANASFFSSFVYRNHAGSYLNLLFALCLGLAAWYYFHGLRRMEKSNPAGIFAFFACAVAVGVVVTFSRGAALGLVIFLPIALALFFVHQFRNPALPRRPAVVALLVIAFAAFVGLGLQSLSANQAWLRVQQLIDDRDLSIDVRQTATTAATDMYRDHWLAGTGASGFRYLFPSYQRRYPLIYGRHARAEQYWEHVHNDLLEIPLELGLPGVVVILFCGGYWTLLLIRQRAFDDPLCPILLVGCLVTVAHARVDFVFQNPATLLTWCACWPAMARWTETQR